MNKTKKKLGRRPKWGDGEGAVFRTRIPQEVFRVMDEIAAREPGMDKSHLGAVYIIRGLMADGYLDRAKYRAILKNAEMVRAA